MSWLHTAIGRFSCEHPGTGQIPPTRYLLRDIGRSNTLFVPFFTHMDPLAFKSERTRLPAELRSNSESASFHIHVIEEILARVGVATQTAQTLGHIAGNTRKAEFDLSEIQRQVEGTQRRRVEANGICRIAANIGVRFRIFSIMAKDAGFIAEAALEEPSMHCKALIPRRSEVGSNQRAIHKIEIRGAG